MYSTDDRYSDDIHFMGGCVVGIQHLSWSSQMLLWNARPPLPQKSEGNVGKYDWKEEWKTRLNDSLFPWIEEWMDHQTRDSFWKHSSICENYVAITCPVFLIGGFGDGYTGLAKKKKNWFQSKC